MFRQTSNHLHSIYFLYISIFHYGFTVFVTFELFCEEPVGSLEEFGWVLCLNDKSSCDLKDV